MREECLICKIHMEHGGKCYGKEGIVPCLIFEEDPRGRRVTTTCYYDLEIGNPIPQKNVKYSDFSVNDVHKEDIEFCRIEPYKWVMKGKMGITLKVLISYWDKEGLTDEIEAEQQAKIKRSKFKVLTKNDITK